MREPAAWRNNRSQRHAVLPFLPEQSYAWLHRGPDDHDPAQRLHASTLCPEDLSEGGGRRCAVRGLIPAASESDFLIRMERQGRVRPNGTGTSALLCRYRSSISRILHPK